jgi:WD40 repeat protein/tRNA A-37 threonylcarbamoyl transferase component Bud32
MADKNSVSTDTVPRFEQVLAGLLQAEERGEPLVLSQVLRRYPELEGPLREFFRNREGFDRVAPHLAPLPARPGAPAAPPHLAPGSRFGDYEILGELGRGGMGVVYKARQRSLQRLVALKTILAGQLAGPDEVERFHREARVVAQLEHPNIVPVYEVGAHDGLHYFSMKLIEGSNLSSHLAHYRRHHKAAAFLVARVARAVHFAHLSNVLHRDLKPGNVLLDARKQPHVTDFGLAKRLGESASLSPAGAVIGTAGYMAPEQAAAREGRLTPAADVHGLGAILYECLTGRPPFQGATVVETLRQVLDHPPVPPRRLNPSVPRDLETICPRCLDKRPLRRYASAEALAADLERWIEGKPIQARRVRWPERAWLWCRRRPAIAALSAAAVVLITLAGGLYWMNSQTGQKVIDLTAADKGKQEKIEREAYLKDMRRAQRYLDAGKLTKARELLARWRPTEGKKDRRGFEWHYLNARCREAEFSRRGHESQVQAVAWAPGGERLASADRQGIVRVWSLTDGRDRPLFEMRLKPGGVTALAWSPDGTHLAAACGGVVRLWEAGSGEEEPTLRTAENGGPAARLMVPKTGIEAWCRQVLLDTWIASLIWDPHSHKLALVEASGKVQVWDLRKGKKGQLLGTHEGGVHSAAWSPDGNRLASVGGDGVVRVWRPPNPKAHDLTSPVGAADMITGPRPSYALTWADNKHLNLVCGDGDIRTLDAGTGAEVAARRRLVARDTLVRAGIMRAPSKRFIWGPGGKLLASVEVRGVVSVRGDVTIWDAATGKETISLPSAWSVARPAILQGPNYPTGCSPAWDRGGRRLALGGEDGRIATLYVGSSRRAVRTPILNAASSSAFAWSADGRHVICASDTKLDVVRALQKDWKDRRDARKRAPGSGIGPPPPGPALPPGPGRPGMPVRSPENQIQVCDAVTGEVVRTFAIKVKPNLLAESPDGKWLAMVSGAGVQLRPVDGRRPAVSLDARAGGPLSWAPDGKLLACSTEGRTPIRLWTSDTGKPVTTLQARVGPVQSLAWAPDGKRLAAAGDGAVTVWDVISGKPTPPFRYFVMREPTRFARGKRFAASILAWCNGGKQIAVAGEDEIITIWDVDARKEVKTLPGHTSNETKENYHVVCSVACSPDGKRLAAASPDGTFLIWDTATWQEVLTLRPGFKTIFAEEIVPSHAGALVWSPDGKQLAFFGTARSVTIWDATPQEGP